MSEIAARTVVNKLQTVTTSYYGIGGDSSLIQHVHFKWDNAFAAVITFETSDFTEVDSAVAGTAGDWIQENPTIAYIGSTPAGLAANMTITVPGGTAGGASVHVGNLGSRLLRVKVVCSAQGQLRIATAGKD
jgi:hypothetical protein